MRKQVQICYTGQPLSDKWMSNVDLWSHTLTVHGSRSVLRDSGSCFGSLLFSWRRQDSPGVTQNTLSNMQLLRPLTCLTRATQSCIIPSIMMYTSALQSVAAWEKFGSNFWLILLYLICNNFLPYFVLRHEIRDVCKSPDFKWFTKRRRAMLYF